jgi:hypothetical protein
LRVFPSVVHRFIKNKETHCPDSVSSPGKDR